ncbi:sterol desaturase family protein [Streptomyces sp. NPDC093085]|uniref:sterol desaturase family protein n=1 Tax=Streptomyces sp. NPDC093085 TaxID=3155068 RepID=UPI003449686A
MFGSTVRTTDRSWPWAPPRAVVRALLSRGCHPLLLLSVGVVYAATVRYGWDTGRVTFTFTLAIICWLAVLERLIPYERSWHPSAREWRWYGVYFVITTVGGTLGQSAVVVAAGALATDDPRLPLWAEMPLALLLGSLAGYGVHRLSHTNRWLWRLHGVHHVPEKVNVANNGVNHIADVFISQAVVQFPLALVGFSERAVFGVGLFVVAQGYFVHANIDVRLGRLNHVLVGPEQHRLHHSTVLTEAGHFGSDLSVWDRVFGSFTWRPGRAPVAVGLVDPGSFPATGAFLATLVHPVHPVRRPTDTGGSPD